MEYCAGTLPPLPTDGDEDVLRGISICHDADGRFLQFLGDDGEDPIAVLRHLVEAYRCAEDLVSAQPRIHTLLKDRLGVTLLHLYVHTNTIDYVKESISIHRQTLLDRTVIGLDPSPSSCGIALCIVAQAHIAPSGSASRDSLNEAIQTLRRSSLEGQSDDPSRIASFCALAILLVKWAEQFGGNKELEDADRASLDALNITTSDIYSDSIKHLARAIFIRVEQEKLRDRGDLDEAIALARGATQLLSHVYIPPYTDAMCNLSHCLLNRFQVYGNMNDIDEAIMLARRVLSRCPSSHINRVRIMQMLTACLGTRYDITKNLDDLEEVITTQRTIHRGGLNANSSFLNLGIALRCRYLATGRLFDLDDSLDIFQKAIAANPDNITDRSKILRELGYNYYMRFEETEDDFDLKKAIDHLTESYDLHPLNSGYPDPSMPANGLAIALVLKYRHTGDTQDLIDAIRFGKISLDLRPPGHPARADPVESLTIASCLLSLEKKDVGLLEPAISLLKETLVDMERANSSYLRSNLVNNLACCLAVRHKLLGYEEDMITAIQLHNEVMGDTTMSPMARFECSRTWMNIAARVNDNDNLTAAYESRLGLMPQIAYLGLDNASRLRLLRKTPALSSDAAIHVLRYGTPERAIELLEQGRSIFWSQTLRLRIPSNDLPLELVERLQKLSQKLDVPSPQKMDDRAIANRRRLANDFEAVIDSIRSLPGHERFFRTPLFSELRNCAKYGIAVVLVANQISREAIIIRDSSSTAERLRLPSLSYDSLVNFGTETARVSGNRAARGEASERLSVKKVRPLRDAPDRFAILLSGLWKEIVQPIVAQLGLKVSMCCSRPLFL
jgi:tetratricopeptide (TPR) repeat protein